MKLAPHAGGQSHLIIRHRALGLWGSEVGVGAATGEGHTRPAAFQGCVGIAGEPTDRRTQTDRQTGKETPSAAVSPLSREMGGSSSRPANGGGGGGEVEEG